MRLISCHIENFGKLHDYSVEFSEGVNTLCEENGWGKSTFAAFVRAMFYGLEGERKRSVEENERKRYRPWQGGTFGGCLVFEIQGKEYLISRIFYDKETNDEFELRDARTNLPSRDYSRKIGEEIFKINRESFMRTIFIGQSECETSSTDDINAKIGNLADNSNDLNHFEAAQERLAKIINALTPARISGSLAKRKQEIAQYERIVQDGQGISESLNTYQGYLHAKEEAYDALKARMQEAGEQQTKASRLQSLLAEKSEWNRLKKAVSELKEEQKALGQKFPGEIPGLDEVKRQISLCGELEKAYERVLLYRMIDSENAELASLEASFEKGVPSDMELDAKLEEASRLRELEREISAEQMSCAERARLDELEQFFSHETENVASVVSKWNNRNNRKAALPSNQAALSVLKASLASQHSHMGKASLILLAGIALAVAGVIVTVAFSPVAGILVAAAGAGLVVTGLLIHRRASGAAGQKSSPEMEALQRTIDEDSAFISRTDAEVADYLQAHGRVFEECYVSSDLQEITVEAAEYGALRKKAQNARAANHTKAAQTGDLEQRIAAFLGEYGVSSSEPEFTDDLYTLKAQAARYRTLKDKRDRYGSAKADYLARRKEVAAFLAKYGFQPEQDISSQLDGIRDAVDDYEDVVKLLNRAVSERNRFEEENDVPGLEQAQEDEDLPSLEDINRTILELTEEMEETRNTIVSYNKTLEDLQEKYDEWDESRIRLDELKQLQELEQKKHDHVLMAQKKLGLAKEAMTAKYADPIRKSFGRYYEMITGETADGFHVDANTAVTVDEYGKQRETNTLSCGYRDLIGICLRIALVDAMYQEEIPILIMDDPFTNLDDRKIVSGRQFVERIAEKYQIIYFTCSSSRR